MNHRITLITMLCCLFVSFGATCQLSKADVQQFISAHAPSSAQKLFVTRKVEYNASANDFAKSEVIFDAASTTFTLTETSLRIKDGKGMDVIVPFSAIKYLAYQPETEKFYSSINIQVE